MFFPAGIPIALVVGLVVYNSWQEAQRTKQSKGSAK
jgi:hypothetical protein